MKLTVLIVDDDLGLAGLIADALQHAGYQVELATNGRLGLAMLMKRRIDVVLTDFMMPDIDGGELLRQLRADPVLASTPAILMTATPDMVSPAEAGLHDALLIKPFRITDLLDVLRRVTQD